MLCIHMNAYTYVYLNAFVRCMNACMYAYLKVCHVFVNECMYKIVLTDWQHNGQFSMQFRMQTHIRIVNIYAIAKYIKDLQIYNISIAVYAYIPHFHCLRHKICCNGLQNKQKSVYITDKSSWQMTTDTVVMYTNRPFQSLSPHLPDFAVHLIQKT